MELNVSTAGGGILTLEMVKKKMKGNSLNKMMKEETQNHLRNFCEGGRCVTLNGRRDSFCQKGEDTGIQTS